MVYDIENKGIGLGALNAIKIILIGTKRDKFKGNIIEKIRNIILKET